MSDLIVHLLSGGLDSTVMLYDLHGQGRQVHCLLFDYQQKHVKELEWAKHHCRLLNLPYTLMVLPVLRGSTLTDGSGGVVVPNRNAILLSMAANLAASLDASTVTFAANADDEAGFPDCRQSFIQYFNTLLDVAKVPVQVEAPYLHKKKWWIAGLAREMGVPFEQTWSCYRGGDQPCGECLACQKRNEALNHK